VVLRKQAPEFKSFLKSAAGINVDMRQGNPGGKEGLADQMGDQNRVFAPRKQNARSLKLRRHFPQNKHRHGLELLQMIRPEVFHLPCMRLLLPA
jgi:hypothetical protein